ncbi:MAG: hypothetical protein M3O46_16990 [Myxococcota bacterium]|nr:hypothetical protein [Myxococcota bacterium]
MPQATATAFNQADPPDAFASTRANHERFAFLLLRIGHVPGLALAHLDFRVLLFLLAQKPGSYAAHHHTIAKACDSNTTSIRQSLTRLRAAGVVLWELIPPHHALPTGRFTRTNVNRYRVHLPRLGALVQAPAMPPATAPKSGASTLPKSDASYGTEIRSEQQPPPSTPPPAPRAPSLPAPPEVEAVGLNEVDSELEPIRQSWEKLGLGALDHRSARALENRRAEGATLEQLEAAIAGAGDDDWIRRRAKVPFAVVFASLASLERFAHQGRKILCARESDARRDAEERRKDREWRARATERAELSPTASGHRLMLPLMACPPPRAAPQMTAEQFVRQRVEQLERFEVWGRHHALAEVPETPCVVDTTSKL